MLRCLSRNSMFNSDSIYGSSDRTIYCTISSPLYRSCESWKCIIVYKSKAWKYLSELTTKKVRPLYSNCVRSLTGLLAQWDLDCGMTFHYLFMMAHKSAPMPSPAPHSLSHSFLSQGFITPVSLSSASPALQTVTSVWNVSYPMPTESHLGYVFSTENSPS